MKPWLKRLSCCAAALFFGISFAVPRGAAVQDPGPGVDRVGFPDEYQSKFKLLYTFDRPDNRQVRVIYGNAPAAEAVPGKPFPYGSILVMETHTARLGADGNPALDSFSRYQRDALTAVFVARKERGFGEAYQHVRTGEWEYVAYRPDKSFLTAPAQSGSCARCHLQAGEARDWQFRMGLYFTGAGGDLPSNTIQHYRFLPGELTARSGERVTWYNDDEVDHRILIEGLSGFDSGVMKHGASYSLIFHGPAEYNYRCTIHPTMRGKVIVK
jgi:Cytochrome P460/Copper binding proteins, plastocyanin/azurin family